MWSDEEDLAAWLGPGLTLHLSAALACNRADRGVSRRSPNEGLSVALLRTRRPLEADQSHTCWLPRLRGRCAAAHRAHPSRPRGRVHPPRGRDSGRYRWLDYPAVQVARTHRLQAHSVESETRGAAGTRPRSRGP